MDRPRASFQAAPEHIKLPQAVSHAYAGADNESLMIITRGFQCLESLRAPDPPDPDDVATMVAAACSIPDRNPRWSTSGRETVAQTMLRVVASMSDDISVPHGWHMPGIRAAMQHIIPQLPSTLSEDACTAISGMTRSGHGCDALQAVLEACEHTANIATMAQIGTAITGLSTKRISKPAMRLTALATWLAGSSHVAPDITTIPDAWASAQRLPPPGSVPHQRFSHIQQRLRGIVPATVSAPCVSSKDACIAVGVDRFLDAITQHGEIPTHGANMQMLAAYGHLAAGDMASAFVCRPQCPVTACAAAILGHPGPIDIVSGTEGPLQDDPGFILSIASMIPTRLRPSSWARIGALVKPFVKAHAVVNGHPLVDASDIPLWSLCEGSSAADILQAHSHAQIHMDPCFSIAVESICSIPSGVFSKYVTTAEVSKSMRTDSPATMSWLLTHPDARALVDPDDRTWLKKRITSVFSQKDVPVQTALANLAVYRPWTIDAWCSGLEGLSMSPTANSYDNSLRMLGHVTRKQPLGSRAFLECPACWSAGRNKESIQKHDPVLACLCGISAAVETRQSGDAHVQRLFHMDHATGMWMLPGALMHADMPVAAKILSVAGKMS